MPALNVEKALLEKTRGRLLRTDKLEPPKNICGISANGWNSFLDQIENIEDPLFVDYVIKG